ncbi:hypothetical protein EYF80_007056 [Liparis tanakae]|uniref:Uncharacterized protein n=1 Tax=Liparis tanakae TaxID=230148 RepID=A0A4Z2IYG4_9TELE|nr:hypothetical protein EYF80_007056 [Liparis tanakae]
MEDKAQTDRVKMRSEVTASRAAETQRLGPEYQEVSWDTELLVVRFSPDRPLVGTDGQLSDAERAHQQGVLSGLTAGLEARLELPSAGVHHEHRHVGLEAEPRAQDSSGIGDLGSDEE